MSLDTLLPALKKVKRTGKDSWISCCPSHQDKNPSMTIRALDDGTILLHCFAGCSVHEILNSVNLTFDDLYPEKPKDRKSSKQPFYPRDILASVAKETMIAAIAASKMSQGINLDKESKERLFKAAGRLLAAAEAANA